MDDLQKTWTSNHIRHNHIFEVVDSFIQTQNVLPEHHATIVLACSGGPDSVFLAEYLGHPTKQGLYKVILAYVDHEWRAESKQEVDFCRSLSQKHQFLFETATLSQIQQMNPHVRMNGSKEAYARELRYAFLKNIAKKYTAHAIFLGHHQDDQVETFLVRLIRGSSLTGLGAMRPHSGLFVRPLLCIKKAQILAFLSQNEIPYCIDDSNEDEQYLRNRIRKKLIPAFLEIDNRSIQNIEKLIQRLQNAENCLEQMTQNVFEQIVIKKDEVLYLPVPELITLSQELQYRVLLKFFVQNNVSITFSESFFQEVLRFLGNNKSNTHTINSDFVLKKESNNMRILSNQKTNCVV